LATAKISYKGHEIIKQEKSRILEKSGQHSMDWTSYHSVEDIYGWLDYLEENFPFCKKEVIGKSYEGQDMIVMKVCRGECGKKPAMWIDSGIHAGEWISPAVGTYMLNELVENDQDHAELTEKLDWYFLPSHNPDGYRKSRNGSRDWRKTTSWHEGEECQGTDANRNWSVGWGSAPDSNCNEDYRGPEPFSEIETSNVRDFILERRNKIKFYQSLHSFAQKILLPDGYTDAMKELADRANEALNSKHGTPYTVEPIGGAIGDSAAWALAEAKIPYAYGLELRDTGDSGFELPPEQIIPNGEEVWAFHEVAAQQIIKEFGNQ